MKYSFFDVVLFWWKELVGLVKGVEIFGVFKLRLEKEEENVFWDSELTTENGPSRSSAVGALAAIFIIAESWWPVSLELIIAGKAYNVWKPQHFLEYWVLFKSGEESL